MPDGSRSHLPPDDQMRENALARAAELDRLEWLALRMDKAFRLPGTKIRIGWDSILGLIPGVGDVAAVGPAAYIIYRAHRLGVPRGTLARMGVNVGIDWAIGSVPLIGDLFDVGFKANCRNVELLRGALGTPGAGPSAGQGRAAM